MRNYYSVQGNINSHQSHQQQVHVPLSNRSQFGLKGLASSRECNRPYILSNTQVTNVIFVTEDSGQR